jgi:hypothetical protein
MIDDGANGTPLSSIRMEDDVRRLWRRLKGLEDTDKAPCRDILRHLVRSNPNETLPAQGSIDLGSCVVEGSAE